MGIPCSERVLSCVCLYCIERLYRLEHRATAFSQTCLVSCIHVKFDLEYVLHAWQILPRSWYRDSGIPACRSCRSFCTQVPHCMPKSASMRRNFSRAVAVNSWRCDMSEPDLMLETYVPVCPLNPISPIPYTGTPHAGSCNCKSAAD